MVFTPTILVLGAGSWGTALAMVLARNGHQVALWGRNSAQMQQMAATRQNARFLPEITFPENLHAVSDFVPYLSTVEDVLVVVPSHAFRETLALLAPHLAMNVRICWATKGLEYKTGLLLHQVAADMLGKNRPLAVLSGPSFAMEVAKGLPTAVTVAANQVDYAELLVKKFHHHPSFRPYTSCDMVGVEVGGAVKNVIAIAAGIADGLGLGANSRAALITRGLTEMVRFGTALGGVRETFMGLAGLGDLVLTCTDNQSRNRRMGYALAQGQTDSEAQAKIGQVVEGVHAAREVYRLAQEMEIAMPIVEHVHKVLQGEYTPQAAVQALLSRATTQEI
ncbi:MAG: NAD(P)-dependent glycerol-3-phosphate dehydrogenase [Thiotrichaceae bacterium]|nr:NAD(P)-dependent glycerol-3-phosphate dehydrogenase [Thiotrichaceae bacterium]